MYKIVIILTTLVYCTKAHGVIPPEVTGRYSELTSRRDPSTLTYYRLPTNTIPVRYDLEITTDIDQGVFDFSGKVKIFLKAVSVANSIVIHHKELNIANISLIAQQFANNQYTDYGQNLPLGARTYNLTTEFLTIPLNGVTLTRDQFYKLEINYNGNLRGRKAGLNDTGFYRSSYTNANGTEKWLAVTKFEPTHARHGFPCYDEPALKAKFNIQLKYGSAYNAISNMPERSTRTEGRYRITTFEETPIMSTYLVAYIISDFEHVANLPEPVTDRTKILHRAYGAPTRRGQLNFTLEAGVKILDALDNYLGVKYNDTIPKMDQIGIPDFASGAMENWGLVTYAEGYFYYSSASSFTQRDSISKVVAHEFSHQWFGNLVSPEWWNYIWLNEGFATVFEYYIPNIVYSEYRALDYFTIQVCHRVFITDSISDIRPMTFAAYSPDEISSLFDRVAYDKSGCVLSMIMHALGENTFKSGLTRYLRDRKEKDANSEDLFSALQTEARLSNTIPTTLTVNSVFDKWTKQRGYPILKVTFNAISKAITLEQEAFLIDSLNDTQRLSWTIPYNFITDQELSTAANSNTATYNWLTSTAQTINPTLARNWTNANWVLFNKKSTGYYRVTYDTNNWNAIIRFVARAEDAQKIHYLNRAQLLGDAMNIARANRSSYDIPLRLAQSMMKHEIDYFMWTPFINDFNYLEQITFEAPSYPNLLRLAVEVGSAAYNYYTVTENSTEKYHDTMTRYNLINFMCRVGYSKCLEDTNNALIRYLNNTLPVSAFLKPVILRNGLRNVSNAVFLQVWRLIMSSTTQADRSTFIGGLGFTNAEENIKHLMDSLLIENNRTFLNVTINYSVLERNTILATIAINKVSGFRHVFQFLKSEVVLVRRIFGNNIIDVFSTLTGRTSTAATHAQLIELMTLYRANDVTNRFPAFNTTAAQNIAWNEGAGATIKAPLDVMYQNAGGSASTIFLSTILIMVSLMFIQFM